MYFRNYCKMHKTLNNSTMKRMEFSLCNSGWISEIYASSNVSIDCKTFTTQTFTTPDVHHPQCKIRHSPPQTFTTPCVKSDVHHPRRSPPQTFTTSDVHHPRHSPPQTFTTPYSKMRHSPRLFGLQEHFIIIHFNI